MKTLLVALFVASTPVFAQVAGNAQMYCSGDMPVLNVTASVPAADAGKPGAWFIAAHDPHDATRIAYLTPGGWVAPDAAGGIVAYQGYPAGIPASIAATACVPVVMEGWPSTPDLSMCGQATDPWIGYLVKVGYGVLSPDGEMLVANRRERLELTKPLMIEQGRWRAEYEDDDHMRKSLILKSLREPGNVIDVMTVPYLSCYISG